MIVTQVAGGLGNQMFQYAVAKRLAVRHGSKVKLDTYPLTVQLQPRRELSLNHFNVDIHLASSLDIARLSPHESAVRLARQLPARVSSYANRALYKCAGKSPCEYRHFNFNPQAPLEPLLRGRVATERHFQFDPDVASLPDDVLLVGYWQSEKYFNEIADEIRAELQVKQPLAGRNLEVANQIHATESVALHVRRGDKVAAKNFNATTSVYCHSAIAYFRQKLKNPVFFIFTDDWDWVRSEMPAMETVHHIDHNDEERSYEDLRLMSLCKHNIIAPSSFSWWGAWLNCNPDKIVVSPPALRWMNFACCDTVDVLPQSWVMIDDQ